MLTTAPGRMRRVVDQAGQARDRARAARTIPTRFRPLRWDVARPALLPAVETKIWFLHVRVQSGDRAARETLVEEYRGHAAALARRFYRHGEPLEDLVQVALEALLLALDRFDPARRRPFLGFANPTIVGSLKRHYRDAGWSMRVPRRVHELARAVSDAIDLLHQDLGRPPTPGEIADFAGVDEDRVVEALGAASARAVTSLDAPLAPDASGTVQQGLAWHDPSLRLAEDQTAIAQLVRLLNDDERLLIERYFEQGMSQQEIAGLMGVSQMQVSRSLTKVLRRLRSHLPEGA